MTTRERIEKRMEERRQMKLRGTYESCVYFQRHYVQVYNKHGGPYYVGIYEGHCIEPRTKLRGLDDWCEKYERKE